MASQSSSPFPLTWVTPSTLLLLISRRGQQGAQEAFKSLFDAPQLMRDIVDTAGTHAFVNTLDRCDPRTAKTSANQTIAITARTPVSGKPPLGQPCSKIKLADPKVKMIEPSPGAVVPGTPSPPRRRRRTKLPDPVDEQAEQTSAACLCSCRHSRIVAPVLKLTCFPLASTRPHGGPAVGEVAAGRSGGKLDTGGLSQSHRCRFCRGCNVWK